MYLTQIYILILKYYIFIYYSNITQIYILIKITQILMFYHKKSQNYVRGLIFSKWAEQGKKARFNDKKEPNYLNNHTIH